MNVMRVVVDTHGNTFALVGTNMIFMEDGGGPPPFPLWLFSFDADGQRRFAINISQETPGLENGVALMADPDADRIYLAARTYNYGTSVARRVVVAQARHSVTGALLWEHDLHQGIPVANSTTGEMQLDINRLMLLEPGVLAVAVVEGESLHQAYVVSVSTISGARLWKTQRSGHMRSGASADGKVWESSSACWSSETYVSHISPAGVSSTQRLLSVGMLAFEQDRALVRVSGNAEVAWLTSNLVVTPLPLPAAHLLNWPSAARIEGTLLTLATQDGQGHYLDRYDSSSGSWLWSAPLGPSSIGVSQVWLLRDGGTATSVSFPDGGSGLLTHAGTGEEVERCPYGAAYGIEVTNELYVTQEGQSIVTFDLPGREAATSGWSGPNGFAGTGRAR